MLLVHVVIDVSYDANKVVSQDFHYKRQTVCLLTEFLHSLSDHIPGYKPFHSARDQNQMHQSAVPRLLYRILLYRDPVVYPGILQSSPCLDGCYEGSLAELWHCDCMQCSHSWLEVL